MLLREVEPADVAVFYEHQADAAAARLAAVPSRDRETHAAHWQKILADPGSLIRTVVTDDGRVAGQVMSFSRDGVREVGYWLGREFWGRGLASAAVRAFLDVERHRPLHGAVAEHNTASLHVLERNGFAVVGLERHDDEEPPVRLIVLRLDA